LLIVDGGKGQVKAVLNVFQNLNLKIPVIGLAKNEKHQTEKIIVNELPKAKIKELAFPPCGTIKNFLTNLQAEVHGYVISFHRKLHRKTILS
jgi:excinuclease ABC subunit C